MPWLEGALIIQERGIGGSLEGAARGGRVGVKAVGSRLCWGGRAKRPALRPPPGPRTTVSTVVRPSGGVLVVPPRACAQGRY